MLQIRIAAENPAPPHDSLQRTTIGWRPGMSEDEAWLAGRGVWKFNADRALAQDEAQIVNLDGTVVAIATITGITKHGDRYAVEGDLLRGDPRVGQPTQTPHRSQNPIAYF